jgi:hypothetical protein
LFSLLNADTLLIASAEMGLTPTATRIAPRAAEELPLPAPPTLSTGVPRTPTLSPTQLAAAFATPVPDMITPVLVIEPTSTEPALTVIPTITPRPRATGQAGQAELEQELTEEPNNRTLPPAVYVTNIRTAPNPPPRSGPVTFTASFWNTNREGVGMNWRIVLRAGGQEWGESPYVGITIPPGRTDFSITYVPLNPGPCVPLQVYAVRRNDDNSREYLNGTNQGAFARNIMFC